MNTLDLILTIVFFGAGLAYIGMIGKLPWKGDFLLKAIPAWSLAIMAIAFVPGTWGLLLFVGFLLSSAGDISLSFEGEKFFLIGLVFFLLAHIAFVVTFAWAGHFVTDRWPLLLFFGGFAVVMALKLNPKLGEMRIPVFVYISVIMAMGVFATIGLSPRPWVLIVGAVLFMLSDSLIAVDKFLSPIKGAKYYIMITYYAGQLLICRAFIPDSLFSV